MDDVAIGQNKPVRRNHESRAAAIDFARTAATLHCLLDVDFNDGWRNPAGRGNDGAGIFIEQHRIVGDAIGGLKERGAIP